jgi:G3E family GTPase
VHADKILLNKVDLASREQIDNIRKSLQAVNHHAQLTETSYAKAPLEFLL